MEKQLRNAIGNAAQAVRRLLEQEYAEQLDGIYDIQRSGHIAPEPGAHLTADQRVVRNKIVSAIGYHHAAGLSDADAIDRFTRDAAFTTLNRFVALKMLEARELIQTAISEGENSAGYREFIGLAPGLVTLGEGTGYRLYLESVIDELASEIKVLFDRHDAASLLWPRSNAFDAMLAAINAPGLNTVWADDETIGWFYQFFNSKEERQQMRDGSQAPRNSRELAVRNQFFTPRYVVQFLVDNTLGRTWIEMTNGDTSLTESCEYFVTLEDERPERALKDPRDFKILDPACGSGHFLLYCFDLLAVMYREAWERDLGIDEATGKSLTDTYSTLQDLERAIPSLIVERNLHGVDIDPRAAQIAALAIWLRAQRSWRDAGIAAADRPPIRKTGIVVAEPMPGDPELVADFARSLQPPLLSRLFIEMVQAMTLAGEMGTLLKAETLLADEIARARAEFVNQRIQPQTLPGFGPEVEQGELDLSGIDDDAFFIEAEERLYSALAAFVAEGAGAQTARRRLFADDAAQGVALLDLLRMRFDVVLMNPPFGLMPKRVYDRLVSAYPDAYYDLAVSFVARGLELLTPQGLAGSITTRAFMLVSDAERFRKNVAIGSIRLLADLGSGVMDGAAVDSSAQIMTSEPTDTLEVIDVRKSSEKSTEMKQVAKGDVGTVTVYSSEIMALPGYRIAYDSLSQLSGVFAKKEAGVEPLVAIARIGASTFDDERFLRTRWEVPPEKINEKWMASSRSAEEFSLYYYPSLMTVNWEDGGQEVCAVNERVNGQTAQARQGSSHYGRAGVVFSRRSSPSIAFRIHPAGCSFASNTGVVIPNSAHDRAVLAGVLNSSVMRAAVKTMSNRDSYTVGHVKRLEWPALDENDHARVATLAERIAVHRRGLFSVEETDPWFEPKESLASATTIEASFERWAESCRSTRSTLIDDYDEIDRIVADALGISSPDQLRESFGLGVADVLQPTRLFKLDWSEWLKKSVSLAFGMAFSRWKLQHDHVGKSDLWGEIPRPNRPATETGVYQPEYLVDERGHPLDVIARIDAVVDELWPNDRGALQEGISGSFGKDMRALIVDEFFTYHLNQYTVGKRPAPIYWQLSVPSGRFSIWFCADLLTADSLYRARNDYVEPRLRVEVRRLDELHDERSQHGSALRKDLEAQAKLVDELRTFLADLDVVAPLWRPAPDDGTLLNACMLWKLMPSSRIWHRRLKQTWDALANGHYDWADTAMRLWPERVIPRCAEDRSLAVAHGLLDALWTKSTTHSGHWTSRNLSAESISELVRERTGVGIGSNLERVLQ